MDLSPPNQDPTFFINFFVKYNLFFDVKKSRDMPWLVPTEKLIYRLNSLYFFTCATSSTTNESGFIALLGRGLSAVAAGAAINSAPGR